MYRSLPVLGATLAAAVAATQVAAADAPRAGAAAQGGVSVTPSIVQATARKGATVSTTVQNTTTGRLRVRVYARPWRQARDGDVSADRRRRLSGARVNGARFSLAPGARRKVSVTLTRTPRGGSRFGALEVVGRPARKRRGINVAYRLVASMRFNPPSRRYALRAGSAGTSGGTLGVLVRNAGNTVDPVGGRVSISGPGRGRSATLSPESILPGKLVRVSAGSLRGLRRGRYTARFTLTQGGATRATVSRSFRIGR